MSKKKMAKDNHESQVTSHSPATGPATEAAKAAPDPNWPRDLNARLTRMKGVGMEVTVELGRNRLPLEQIVNMEAGAVIELEKLSGQPVDVRVNSTLFGRGEIVVVGDNLAVRMTELLRPEEMR